MSGSLGEGKKGTTRYLIVRLAGREFGVPAGRICGMMQMRGAAMHPVDGRGAMRYIVIVQGRMLPVYVPNRVLGLKEVPASARTTMLLVNQIERTAMPRCALLVDSVSRVEDVPMQGLRPETPDATQIKLGEKWRQVLKLDELCGE